ncbi:unnamed protein product [Trichogramma brassicae]|uniref:Uncharacterized protein n=1 Tax=Trichogramma brassicae TaxID=86971 RepID=A0A6H5I6P8_9HYME|nr:unnamed protein product [Trichogramma brassicae]
MFGIHKLLHFIENISNAAQVVVALGDDYISLRLCHRRSYAHRGGTRICTGSGHIVLH